VTRLPPLVEPGPELSAQQAARYARHLLLPQVGPAGQRRLAAARVLVVGAGGLGSPVLQYLAAAGVGTLGVVDDDVVEVSNLQRQVLHAGSEPGRRKVDSAAEALGRVNPHVEVIPHPVRLTRDNALDLLAGYHLVLDGSDSFATRYLVNDACALLGLPDVWGSVLGFDGQLSVFWARHGPTYRDLHPQPPPAGSVPSCAQAGVFGALCGVIGSAMAGEAVKLVTGLGEPLVGRVLLHDALAGSWQTVRVRRAPDSPPITGLVDYEAWCGTAPPPPDGISAVELAAMLAEREAGRDDFVLVDVREPAERAALAIPGSVPVPMADFESGAALHRLPGGTRVVLHCQSGVRSARALGLLRAAGRADATHLDGGVLAWATLARP
jgi:adenylyltransferase/sulfurtransferase